MKLFSNVFVNSNRHRFVLVLQDSAAFWFKVEDGKVVSSFVDTVDEAVDQLPGEPSWIETHSTGRPQKVELVLDTTLDEVDRVSVPQTGHTLVDGYRRIRTLARLRKDYPHASVYRLPAGYHNHVAAVMHPAHPAHWSPWLARLQERDVVFHQVCTATELVAHWSRGQDNRMLLVMQSENYQRHLFVHSGAVVFLRCIELHSADSSSGIHRCARTQSAIEQSLTYLSKAIDADAEGMPVISICGCVAADSPDALAAMLLTNTVVHDRFIWRQGHLQSMAQEANKPQNSISTTSDVRLPFSHWLSSIKRIGKVPSLSGSEWSLLGSASRWIDALSPSVQYQSASRHIETMLRVSAALAVVATVALSLAVAHGVTNARLMHGQKNRKEAIDASTLSLLTTSRDRYQAPQVSADSLFLVERLASLKTYEPQTLIDDIATVITRAPDILLDKITWALVEKDEMYASLSHALASVGHRNTVDAQAQNLILQLEISGRAAGDSLADRKRHLDDFVSMLGNLEGAREVRVVESPVDAAMTSNSHSIHPESFLLSLRKDKQ